MGKRSGGKKERNNTPAASNTKWLIIGGAVVLIAAVWFTLHVTNKPPESAAEKFQPEKEHVTLIATLSPDGYTGKAKAAYQVAKEIPEILSQLPCFCGCMDNLGHKSNLYCFADNHGNICDLCQNIALEASVMHKKGLPVEKIRENIRQAYSTGKM